MILGKWNKSVVLSYVGLLFSVLGIFLCIRGVKIELSFVCFIVAGVCDLFDGTVARMCKRTDEEKQFGIELDSCIDVFTFVAFPITLSVCAGFSEWVHFLIYGMYAIFAIARLAQFNMLAPKDNKPVPYYVGMPVTYAAFFFPLVYLLRYVTSISFFQVIFPLMIACLSVSYVLPLKIPKPKMPLMMGFAILAIIVSIVYLFFV